MEHESRSRDAMTSGPESYPSPATEVPWISVDEMIEVDRLMVEDLGVELLQMMENAGRGLGTLARGRFLEGDPRQRRVMLAAGGGGNGGGGMVAARRLAEWGASVTVVTGPPDRDSPTTARQRRILGAMGVAVHRVDRLPDLPLPELVLDAVIGYSLRGAPTGAPGDMVRLISEIGAPVLSLDIPSGVDADTGQAHSPHVEADATLTLALPKSGLRAPAVGELYLADIGVPAAIYRRLGRDVGPIFARSDIVRL